MIPRFECDCVDSTNAEARRLLASWAIGAAAVVTAREQTAGRGTGGRTWLSPRDAGVYLTYVRRGGADGGAADGGAASECSNEGAGDGVERDLPLTTLYTYAAGVACVEAVRAVTGVELRIKPVNDLVWRGRKVGGILTEAVIEDGRMTALIIGVGINVWPAERAVPRGAMPAGCLAQFTKRDAMPLDAVDQISFALAEQLNRWTMEISYRHNGIVYQRWSEMTAMTGPCGDG